MNQEAVTGLIEFAFVCALLDILGAIGAPVRSVALLNTATDWAFGTETIDRGEQP